VITTAELAGQHNELGVESLSETERATCARVDLFGSCRCPLEIGRQGRIGPTGLGDQ
jgi:hypothetical protein